ncbi:ABC transporter ATP-binding protein [Prevotella scopos JCM 17725]|jgi:ABC transporter, ATP-binding protein|uniref:ABC-2 type transport system ATP-binding protein n=1 Tax=Prevotella scopos JCM 17725 TaxID=1236518 RepID=A0AAX2F719_9BACT|nr:ABC transporter ATP-binding protein [Prevotella scopos]ANR74013.1 ATP-binding protein [Prevotella scopos JCM 17725]QUB44607.1 ABC transporter ATP-binding protein [Prevotella scopos JCM 17725]SHG14086.1 ABC-2 type transport system ATP-binding protein [Prevotella scopos JCM 17725]
MVAISVNNLIKKFGDKTAVSIPDFYFPPNEIIGLVGNNGAGKTTLFRLILNLIKADSGSVNFCLTDEKDTLDKDKSVGRETVISNLKESWKSFIAAYLDESFLIDFLTPKEFFSFIAKVNNIDEKDEEERLNSLHTFLGDEILERKVYIRELSAGNKQKVGIAAALLSFPKFIILDEPFNFLDPSSQNHLKKVLMEYKNKHKASILISSHNLYHTTDISDRIVLMENGKIIKDIAEVTQDSIKDLDNYFF